MKKISQSTVTLCRYVIEIANRLEKIGIGHDGALDPDDEKLIKRVRAQADKVLSEPLRDLTKPIKKETK
jgi:hypothetical protein